MSRLVLERGFDPDDAQEFKRRANGPHTLKWKANVTRWIGGEETQLYHDLPITGGTLTLDSSDPTRRKLTLEIAGLGQLVPDAPNDPLACFGQIVKLWCTIDRQDGTWFDWIKMGEFPIQTTTSEWPSMIQTIECADYSVTVDDYLHEHKRAYNKLSVYNAIKQITEAALPDRAFSIHTEDNARNIKVEPHTVAEAGSSRWETATTIAQARGFETFFDWNGNLVIRHDLTNDDADSIPGVGPDIGSMSSPVAVIADGPGGNLVGLTSSVTREGACNGVFITMHETISQKIQAKKSQETKTGVREPDPDDVQEDGSRFPPDDENKPDAEVPMVPNPKAGDRRVNVTIQALGTGPIAWGDKYGRQPIVLERNVKRITDSNVSTQKRRAKRLLHRRGGVIRSIDMDVVGLYWVEPDDRVRVHYDGRTEAHYIASIEFDLAGKNPARIKTRSLTVEDPG